MKKNNFLHIITNFTLTCFDVIGGSTVILLIDFDPKRLFRLQSLIILECNSSRNPVNDLKSLLSNRLFGFKFDKSKTDIANDFPT